MLMKFEPKSSHLRKVEYDPERKELTVHFHNGSEYRYVGFPMAAYENFQKYRSAGEFLHGVVKLYKGFKIDKSGKVG